MQRRWVGKNVNLAELTSHIGDFFKTRDFEAIRGETPKGFQILASDSPHFRLEGHVCVNIDGNPEDFVVEFDLCNSQKRRDYLLPNPITRMFIGGYLSLRKMKSDETWIKLEKELLQYVENAVLSLVGSSPSKGLIS
jgi:hypothetical protein